MLRPKNIGAFVIVVTLALIGFDVYLAMDDIEGNTYSENMRKWGVHWRMIPYFIALCFGALLTHWFAKRDNEGTMSLKKKLLVSGALLIATGIGAVLGLFW